MPLFFAAEETSDALSSQPSRSTGSLFVAPQKTPPPDVEVSLEVDEEATPRSGLEAYYRPALRFAEGAIGGAGELASLARGALGKAGSFLPGAAGEKSAAMGRGQAPVPFMLDPNVFFDTEKLQGLTNKLLGDKGTPSTDTQKAVDEWAQRFGLLVSPPGGAAKAATKGLASVATALGKGALTSGGAQAGKEFAQFLGAGEGGQAAAEIGTMVLMGLFNPGGARRYVNQLEKAYEASVPQNAMADATTLKKRIQSIRGQLSRSLGAGSTKDKKVVEEVLDLIEPHIQHGEIPINRLADLTMDINAKIGEASTLKGARKFLKPLVQGINASVEETGRRYPEFAKLYKEYKGGFRGLEESKEVASKLGRTASKLRSPLTLATWGLLHGGPGGAAKGLALGGGIQGVIAMNAVLRNAALRKYYLKTLEAAAKGTTKELNQAAQQYDKALRKKVKDDPYWSELQEAVQQ